jgi:hypothetical protein
MIGGAAQHRELDARHAHRVEVGAPDQRVELGAGDDAAGDHRRPLADAVAGDRGRADAEPAHRRVEQPAHRQHRRAVLHEGGGGDLGYRHAEVLGHVVDAWGELAFEAGEDEGETTVAGQQRFGAEPEIAAAAHRRALGDEPARGRQSLGGGIEQAESRPGTAVARAARRQVCIDRGEQAGLVGGRQQQHPLGPETRQDGHRYQADAV